MKFTNIKLADGIRDDLISGARPGQGLKRGEEHYVMTSHYSFSTSNDGDVDTDYYAVWNNWPVFTGTNANKSVTITGLTALTNIGITNIYTRSKHNWASGYLDMAIIRKSDRKAVSVIITGEREDDYREDWTASNATVVAIDPDDGPWTPEVGRLVNMGYIG